MSKHDNSNESSDSASGIRARCRSVVQLPRPSIIAAVGIAASMMMVAPAAAQAKGICAIGAAESVLELGFLIMVGSIGALGIYKFGGGIAKWLMGGSKGSAALRLSLLAALGGLFLALGFESILKWFVGEVGGGGGLGSIGLKCMLPG